MFLGDILSYRGEFREAAECYQKGGKPSHALQMYTDLRMFDLAQVCDDVQWSWPPADGLYTD